METYAGDLRSNSRRRLDFVDLKFAAGRFVLKYSLFVSEGVVLKA